MKVFIVFIYLLNSSFSSSFFFFFSFFHSVFLSSLFFFQASWLPPPLSRVGAVFSLLQPKEIYTLLSTMWKVLKVLRALLYFLSKVIETLYSTAQASSPVVSDKIIRGSEIFLAFISSPEALVIVQSFVFEVKLVSHNFISGTNEGM